MSCSEWRETTLNEIYAFSSGLSKSAKEFGFGSPFLSFKTVFNNCFIPEAIEDLANTNEKEQGNCSVKKGDVFLTRTSESLEELGMSCVALKDYPKATFNGFTKRLRPKNGDCINPLFAAYYFRSPKFRSSVTTMASLTTRASLNNDMLARLPITIPPLAEQTGIANVLYSLDQKIELNNRINKTLEEMAQAIFKQWFVDFDFPDENGQPYKSSGGEMEESELGLIPKGWKVSFLGDIAQNIRDGVATGNIADNTAYIGLEHMPRKCLALSNWDEKPELMSNKFKFHEGDILFGKLRPYFHKVGIASISGICSTDILVINVKEPRWYSFALMHLFAEGFIDYTSAVSTGTKMPRTNWTDMARYQIIVPSFTLVAQFEELIQPSLCAIKKNVLENRALVKTRDALLPKLMSGEIRVPIKEATR